MIELPLRRPLLAKLMAANAGMLWGLVIYSVVTGNNTGVVAGIVSLTVLTCGYLALSHYDSKLSLGFILEGAAGEEEEEEVYAVGFHHDNTPRHGELLNEDGD